MSTFSLFYTETGGQMYKITLSRFVGFILSEISKLDYSVKACHQVTRSQYFDKDNMRVKKKKMIDNNPQIFDLSGNGERDKTNTPGFVIVRTHQLRS